ncbi:MAG TPA: hypothetical protein VKA67_03430 [Verrucomicrobiae bacterium]|nr:hypothetical protein [Verrucomicrobiae bacterium]
MKINCQSLSKRERGSAVLVFIMLLTVMLILVAADTRALFHLDQQIKLLNREQLKRLDASNAGTNLAVRLPAETESK